jgi:hypothetical protein
VEYYSKMTTIAKVQLRDDQGQFNPGQASHDTKPVMMTTTSSKDPNAMDIDQVKQHQFQGQQIPEAQTHGMRLLPEVGCAQHVA